MEIALFKRPAYGFGKILIFFIILYSRYATEVDVDFVRKAVRAIGRCAIKVETSAERCVSTLLDLIQTKVLWRFYLIIFLTVFIIFSFAVLIKWE